MTASEMEYQRRLHSIFSSLDRSFFLDDACKAMACFDGPLPIGHGQTISQPSLVLEMTLQLHPEASSRVMEIGTGSGYQTALLAALAREVYTIERIPDLSALARERITALGYENVFFKIGDGSDGWAENAPYDRIIATAAAGSLPEALLEQLAPQGRMIIPVGPPTVQELLLITKSSAGQIRSHSLGGVRFVEFVGKYGWKSSL